MARARDVLAAGDLEGAWSRIEALYAAHPGRPDVLEIGHEVAARQGALTEQARMLFRLNTIAPTEERLARERAVEGELAATSPGWLPRIPGAHPQGAPDGDAVVLRLLDAAAAGRPDGIGSRDSRSVAAAQRAGIRLVLVPMPRRTEDAGARPAARSTPWADVEHRAPDLGPFYPPDGPLDQWIMDLAWLSGVIGRRAAPGVIHVSAEDGAPWALLVGLALRAHLDRPLVCEVLPGPGQAAGEVTLRAASEWRQRVHATQERALAAADHVIADAEPWRAALIAGGVASERVTVIPAGIEDDALGSALRACYGGVLARWRATGRGAG